MTDPGAQLSHFLLSRVVSSLSFSFVNKSTQQAHLINGCCFFLCFHLTTSTTTAVAVAIHRASKSDTTMTTPTTTTTTTTVTIRPAVTIVEATKRLMVSISSRNSIIRWERLPIKCPTNRRLHICQMLNSRPIRPATTSLRAVIDVAVHVISPNGDLVFVGAHFL